MRKQNWRKRKYRTCDLTLSTPFLLSIFAEIFFMNFHFIAIGGSAMHNLALALHAGGDVITGSDDAIYEPSRSRLLKHNLLPNEMGWFPEKINPALDGIILGMHAREDNPELLKARELGLKIYSYPEFLFKHSQNKTRVVIGGSHGKTTITSMILHVMKYHGKEIDFMVGAQIEGYDNMVHLTRENDFILLEGDEYLSSPIDRRPKFHLYRPNIALLSGIAWDHINVFPTFDNYVDQFRIFIETITTGGILVYNAEDPVLSSLVDEATNPIRKQAYLTHEYRVENDLTVIDTPEGDLQIDLLGSHNMNNLSGAKWVCQHMGIDEDDFYEAIASFKGASKRLEVVVKTGRSILYKDFAHSPSKVRATTRAVKEQFPDRKVFSFVELHTFSSLSPLFLEQYKGSLEYADEAAVFYSPEALQQKKMAPIEKEDIYNAFEKNNLQVFTDPRAFKIYVESLNFDNSALLFMSSGNYGGLNLDELGALLTS